MTKFNRKVFISECADIIHTLAKGQNGITAKVSQCETEEQVLLACNTFAEAVKIEAKAIQPYLTRTWQNGVTQYITRCRSGDIKLPASFFDPARTVSFASDPFEFVAYKPRNTKRKTDKQAEAEAQAEAISKQAEAQAEAMLKDKATLSKAQAAKVEKAQAEAQAKAEKAQAQAKQAISLANKAEADLSKQGQALQALQVKYKALQGDYEKALRQVEALTKALKLANVEQAAVEALIRHA